MGNLLCNDKIHRNNDLPKVIYTDSIYEKYKRCIDVVVYTNGIQAWYEEHKRCVNNDLSEDLPTFVNRSIYGNEYIWFKKGCLHRDNDLPAIINEHIFLGEMRWYKKGKLHRDNDLPAVISRKGTQEWYKKGKLHRDNDLPAVVITDYSKEWYKNGKLHRDNDKPADIDIKIVKWYVNGKFIKEMSREKYNKLSRLYIAVQLYRKKSAKEESSLYEKWNKSRILEPLLTGMIIKYI